MQNDDRNTKRINLDESKLIRLAGGRGDANPRMIGSPSTKQGGGGG